MMNQYYLWIYFMKPIVKKHGLMCAVLIGGSLLSAQAAQANVTFNSSAALTFTINSITNLNAEHPNDLSGLEVLGSFEQASVLPYFYTITSGDGSVTANNPSVLPPVTVSNSFSHSFAVSGSALNGAVDSYHTGWFNLDFNNTGGDSYNIDLTLDYQLNAEASGLFANSNVALDYGYTGNSFTGSDSVDAFTFAGFPYDTDSLTGSNGLIFTLGSGSTGSFYADAVITENLAPVPVPAAVWFFASGLLGVIGLNKRKLTSSLI
jgi:hypothetical protein